MFYLIASLRGSLFMQPLHSRAVLEIRQMTPADVPAVSELVRSTLELDYSMDTYLGMFSFWPAGALVGRAYGEIIAFLGAIIPAEGESRILLFAVDSKVRGQGYGSRLLKYFVNSCSGSGIKVINLEVRKSNEVAIYFYRKQGFQVVEEMENYYANGENGYRMELWL